MSIKTVEVTESGVRPASPADQASVIVEELRKSYGEVKAASGISFEVQRGEVFGLLGPNGAGKTTTVEIIEGLREPDGGRVRVCGFDPQQVECRSKLYMSFSWRLRSPFLSFWESGRTCPTKRPARGPIFPTRFHPQSP